MPYTYKIKKMNKDSSLAVIEKTGGSSQFTLQEIYNWVIDAEKSVKELTAKKEFNDTFTTKFAEEFPMVKQVKEEELKAFLNYFLMRIESIDNGNLIKDYMKELKNYAKEVAEIKKQVGIND